MTACLTYRVLAGHPITVMTREMLAVVVAGSSALVGAHVEKAVAKARAPH